MPERWAAEGNPYQPSGAAWVGADAIVENLFMKLATEWDGFSLHPGQYHDAGDTVVVEGRYMGKYLATGTAVDSQYCHVFKFMSLRPCIRASVPPLTRATRNDRTPRSTREHGRGPVR